MPPTSSDDRAQVKLITLGCPKNAVDSEAMMGALQDQGYSLTDDEDAADVLVVNTCAFIDRAKEESVDTILATAALKEADPSKRLVVTGCLAQRYASELAVEMPEVDAFIGTSEFLTIGDVVSQVSKPRPQAAPPIVNVSHPAYQYTDPLSRVRTTPWHYAYMKIGEGCDHRCTFCAIPSFRGDFVSRSMESLEQEAGMLAASGVKELVLISQDTTYYGRDMYGEGKLPELLRRLAQVNGIEWIRMLYLYPTMVDDALLDVVAQEEKVCAYLDVPLQHIDDGVLRRMGRASSEASVRALVTRMRDRVPDVALRTSFIVGFPGETDAAFASLLDFVVESEFDHCGVFAYSPEDGTPSADWDGQIPDDVKQERFMELVATQTEVGRELRAEYVGRTVEVLVDGRRPEAGVVEARMRTQAPEIDDVVHVEGTGIKSGAFVKARITEASDLDLYGRLVE
ncbi:30S ribosomal protein S12 methylthiotransferase RimO [Candidatus Poribacteria bacterium]|nr:30S ribosomal protein S12 methylthiotransferase RimO [Candidatus Poribacteria bacterium]MBT5533417.1 30S ribosomal protein S12 methylthiotransferase RimO [Candidatus Poribacteria bacterium]MBT5713777.1 30S ribosomal protein S12 methylthiotransferase RimO [Candidatus Poribacteria bacterium]MBT7100473.1 30S ribosomal protein S12 methylthiotransferase RimO [Candidatus Poribacteria bacterium]MBT7808812.1 30S ribosomal protein S12 methylthiotransferase RimO [Candidatus Poribacteria bacterium]